MLMLDWCDTLIVLQNGQVGAMLYPRTDPVEALQSALGSSIRPAGTGARDRPHGPGAAGAAAVMRKEK